MPHVPVLLPQILGFFEGRAVNVRFQKLPPARRSCGHRRVTAALTRPACSLAQCYVDATLGAGGHASAMLSAHPVRGGARRLAPQLAHAQTLTAADAATASRPAQELRTFVGIDQDPTAHALAQPRCTAAAPPGAALQFVRRNFREFGAALADAALPPASVDGALFDLGMSSMQARSDRFATRIVSTPSDAPLFEQIDTAERGFSFLRDGPIDMRMDPSAALSAEDVVNTWSEAELGRILRDYGEERRWKAAAKRLVLARSLAPLRTTAQLVAAMAPVLGVPGGKGIHPATRMFQALRIAVNGELAAVEEALPVAIDALAPGGRLAVISFHSLEDRIVKHLFRDAAGKTPPPDEGPVRGWQAPPLRAGPPPPPPRVALLTSKPVVADESESRANPRARSAKLRVVEKL